MILTGKETQTGGPIDYAFSAQLAVTGFCCCFVKVLFAYRLVFFTPSVVVGPAMAMVGLFSVAVARA